MGKSRRTKRAEPQRSDEIVALGGIVEALRAERDALADECAVLKGALSRTARENVEIVKESTSLAQAKADLEQELEASKRARADLEKTCEQLSGECDDLTYECVWPQITDKDAGLDPSVLTLSEERLAMLIDDTPTKRRRVPPSELPTPN